MSPRPEQIKQWAEIRQRNMADFAHEQLSRLLRSELPEAIRGLDQDDAARLVVLIETSIDDQAAEIRRAERDLLTQIPLPLRGAVKRLLR